MEWRLVVTAVLAATAPDIDGLFRYLFHVPGFSIYPHRGDAHSLFVALAAPFIGACSRRPLRAKPLTAAVVAGASMASDGMLDMMTDFGRPVGYRRPLSSARLFADWRPIHSGPVHALLLLAQAPDRLGCEIWLIIGLFATAFVVRAAKEQTRSRSKCNGRLKQSAPVRDFPG
jgi:membrane-bound metal-dependent hydrolase YbcI (DUF457 family)